MRAFLIIFAQVISISPLVLSTSCRRFASNARTARTPNFRFRPRASGSPWWVVPFSNFLNAENHTGWIWRPARSALCISHISFADNPWLCHRRTNASSTLVQCGAISSRQVGHGSQLVQIGLRAVCMLETIGFSIGPRIEGPFSMYIDKLTNDDGKSNIKAACPLYLRASEYTTTRRYTPKA